MDLRSGYPFWLIKDGLLFDYPKLEEDITTDVLVLGGGISGALVAHYLVEAGVDTTVIDARTVGLGSTCVSTCLLQYEIDVPLSKMVKQIGEANAVRAYELCRDSIAEIERITKYIGLSEFRSRKSLYYAAYKKDRNFLKREFAIRKEKGFPVEWLDGTDIRNRFGFAAPSGILSDCGAEIDAYKFTHVLHQFGLKKGLRVFDRTRASAIRHSKSGVKVVTAQGHVIKAKKLVYATGYEAVDYVDEKIVKLHSTYAVASEQFNDRQEFWNHEALLWNTADPYLYLRTTADKRVIIGGRDEPFFTAGKRDRLIEKKKKQLASDFNKTFPHIPFEPEFAWTGTFGCTVDGLPFIGPYRKLPNGYFALGFGGNGITFSVVAAQILRDLLTGKRSDDQKLFAFERLSG